MLLSIVVPTYNVSEYLGNCLDSLLNQNIAAKEYEIIVVNDGSTDNSLEIAKEHAKRNPNIKIHTQKNQGLSAARNKGIDLATGKYIYFIDSDDYISRNCLDYILKSLEKHQLDVLGIEIRETKLLTEYESSNLDSIKNEKLSVVDGITYIYENKYLNNAWWYFINREYLLKTGLIFPVGRMVEDANFTAKLLSSANKIAQSKLDVYRYLIRQGSIMRKKNPEHYKKLLLDYEKNVVEFADQIKTLDKMQHPKLNGCLRRIKTRQQSFVFFQVLRLFKSNLPMSYLDEAHERFREINAYPLTHFPGKDYKGISYRILTFIINRKMLLKPFGRIFRAIYSIAV